MLFLKSTNRSGFLDEFLFAVNDMTAFGGDQTIVLPACNTFD